MDFLNSESKQSFSHQDLTPLNSAFSSPSGTPRTDWEYSTSNMSWNHMHAMHPAEESQDDILYLLIENSKDGHDNVESVPSKVEMNQSIPKKRRKTHMKINRKPAHSLDMSSESTFVGALDQVREISPSVSKMITKSSLKNMTESSPSASTASDGNISSGGESVQSTGSGGSRGGRAGKKRSIEETKASHRAIERRRTRRLNDLIQQLKSEVKVEGIICRKDKASILEAAINCIHNLRSKSKDLSGQLELSKMREKAYLVSHGMLLQSKASECLTETKIPMIQGGEVYG